MAICGGEDTEFRHTNEVTGVYETTGDSTRLYSYLDRLQKSNPLRHGFGALHTEGKRSPTDRMRDNLGDMTELRPGKYIEEF
jgi:hypothetical protein